MGRVKDKPNRLKEGNFWGAKVAERRVALGMTQTRFAEALSINPRTIQAWESGRRTAMFPALVEDAITQLELAEAERRADEEAAETEAAVA